MKEKEAVSIRDAYLQNAIALFTDAFNEGYKLGQQSLK